MSIWWQVRRNHSVWGDKTCWRFSFCSVPLVTEAKQELITYPQPQKTSIPAPSEKQPSQPRSADKESEPKKREEGQEPRLGHQKREAERYLPPSRREGLTFRRDREKEPWSGETRPDGESKSKWFVGACTRP